METQTESKGRTKIYTVYLSAEKIRLIEEACSAYASEYDGCKIGPARRGQMNEVLETLERAKERGE